MTLREATAISATRGADTVYDEGTKGAMWNFGPKHVRPGCAEEVCVAQVPRGSEEQRSA